MRKLTLAFLLLLLTTLPASGQVLALVQSNSATTASAQTLAVTINTTSVGAGDLVKIGVNWGGLSTDSMTVTDDHANSYTQCPVSATAANILRCFWTVNPSSQTSITATVTLGGGVSHTIRMVAFEYSSTTGWPASPVDQSNTASSGAGVQTGTAGNITPTSSGQLLLCDISWGNTVSSVTATAPFTLQAGAGTGWGTTARAESADIQSGATTSTQTCTINWVTAVAYGAIIVSFKPNAAAGGATPSINIRRKKESLDDSTT